MAQCDNGSDVPLLCDGCGAGDAKLWCDQCSEMICTAAACTSRHDGHPTGAIGASDDAYNYEGDGDDDAGVIVQKISEADAYRVVELLEDNAHKVCRRLFRPAIREAGAALNDRAVAEGDYSGELLRRLACSQRAAFDPASGALMLSEAQWHIFAATSFLVLDGLVSPAEAMAARQQTLALVADGALTELCNPRDVGRDNSARSDLRTFMKAGEGPAAAGKPMAALATRMLELGAALKTQMNVTGRSSELQLAYYGAEGQRYVQHRDAFPSDGRGEPLTGQVGRRVTCTLYMNEHQEGAGGLLRLQAPAPRFDEEVTVDVEPQAGRGVLFLSGAMDHEVTPSFAPRCAIAAWYS